MRDPACSRETEAGPRGVVDGGHAGSVSCTVGVAADTALDSSRSASGAVVQQLSGMAAAMPTRVATFAIGALLLASQAAGLDNGLGLTPVRAHMYRS